MNLHLRDKNPAVVAAWHVVFFGVANVTISEGDILDLEGDAIVSPANSFGWMDGGIDLAYRERFGHRLERAVQRQIESHHNGELPVGEAMLVHAGDERIRSVVIAPTMRIPERVPDTVNAYLAMRAALLAFRALERQMRRPCVLLSPGLCTLSGRMPPMRAAAQMRHAWDVVAGGHRLETPAAAIFEHVRMVSAR